MARCARLLYMRLSAWRDRGQTSKLLGATALGIAACSLCDVTRALLEHKKRPSVKSEHD
eukprot:CAMPEP_0115633696 /NCGR_PEP_ID=MMETSP0272-20121206/32192_1 /TAXON_ID=71861 /ORGANISM="Scrippsiella trochoidea, Strain CCMP3099" /LENGTH=58 /DNA_ID=CAMNT_0003070489 /DNA_START=57 /DNA_END=233 /DNA_ORIENTATION=-